jgi:hypothetical protein
LSTSLTVTKGTGYCEIVFSKEFNSKTILERLFPDKPPAGK